jgi:hypothetical protein
LIHDPLDLAKVLSLLGQQVKLGEGHLELAGRQLLCVLISLIRYEARMLKDILDDVQKESHVHLGWVIRLFLGIWVQLVLGIFKERLQ